MKTKTLRYVDLSSVLEVADRRDALHLTERIRASVDWEKRVSVNMALRIFQRGGLMRLVSMAWLLAEMREHEEAEELKVGKSEEMKSIRNLLKGLPGSAFINLDIVDS